MTRAVISEIKSTDCSKVEKLFAKKGINSDFDGNKIVAWSTLKVSELLTKLQKSFGVKFDFPANIIVESFSKYKKINHDRNVAGFTNFLPVKLKDDESIVPPMTIFFNQDFPWRYIDGLSDLSFKDKDTVTDNFLEPFIHEFGHIIHEGNLLRKLPVNDVPKTVDLFSQNKIPEKYANTVKEETCSYAASNFLELIACDICKRFLSGLDSNLEIKRNLFSASPYDRFYKYKTVFDKQNPYDKLVLNTYNGIV